MLVGSTLSDRKTQQEDEIVLDLLDAVDGNAVVTQRHLAQELGIALGLANSYLKRCVRKGLLKVSKVPAKRYAYYITPKGFAEKSRLTGQYLASSFDFLRRARTELQDIFASGLKAGRRRFLLIGEGDLAEIAKLVAGNAGVEIVHVVGVRQGALDALPPATDFDIAVITATDAPGEAYRLAISSLGDKPIQAPKLLRIRPTTDAPEQP